MGNRGRGAPTRRGRPSRRRRPSRRKSRGRGVVPPRDRRTRRGVFDQLSVPHARAGGRGARGALAPGGGSGFFGGARFARGGGRGATRRPLGGCRDAPRSETGRGETLAVLPLARRGRAPRALRGAHADARDAPAGAAAVGAAGDVRPPLGRGAPLGVEGPRGRLGFLGDFFVAGFPARASASRGFQPERGERDRRGGASPPRRPRAPDADARSGRAAAGEPRARPGPRGRGAPGGGRAPAPPHLPHRALRVLSLPLRRRQLQGLRPPVRDVERTPPRRLRRGPSRVGGHGMPQHGVQRAGAERGGVPGRIPERRGVQVQGRARGRARGGSRPAPGGVPRVLRGAARRGGGGGVGRDAARRERPRARRGEGQPRGEAGGGPGGDEANRRERARGARAPREERGGVEVNGAYARACARARVSDGERDGAPRDDEYADASVVVPSTTDYFRK